MQQTKLRKALTDKLKKKLATSLTGTIELKKKITETKNSLDKIEERFVTGQIQHDLYTKYSAMFQQELNNLDHELKQKRLTVRTLKKLLRKDLKLLKTSVNIELPLTLTLSKNCKN